MKKLVTSKIGNTGLGLALLSKLTHDGQKPTTTAPDMRRSPQRAPSVNAQPLPAAPIVPARHGVGFEDPFAADLRAVADHRQSVLDQIKGVQRDGATTISRETIRQAKSPT